MQNSLILSSDLVCFTTREFSLLNKQSMPSASRTLNKLAEKKLITRVTKGIWANTRHPYFTPLSCVPLLIGKEQGYISFLSALHRHGIISQIPTSIQVATTGHTRKLRTPIGTYEFLQLKPIMMTEGIEWSETRLPYRIASAEKALLDTLYISTRRAQRFLSLPETDLAVNLKKLKSLLNQQVKSKIIRSALNKRLASLGLQPNT